MNEWISVRDRLPENGTTVIAATSGAVLGIVNYNEGFNVVRDCDGKLYREAELHGIEYWQPAPAAPQKKEEFRDYEYVRKTILKDGLYVRLNDVIGLCPRIVNGLHDPEYLDAYARGIADYKELLRKIR